MRKPSVDQAQAATGAVLILLGVFEVHTMHGISGDDLSLAVGACVTLVGIIRHRVEARRWSPTPVVDEPTTKIPPVVDEPVAEIPPVESEGDG